MGDVLVSSFRGDQLVLARRAPTPALPRSTGRGRAVVARWAAAFVLLAGIATFATAASGAAPADGQTELVQATLLADVDAAAPGSSFRLGVRLKMKDHWHTYWVSAGESGDPTQIRLTGPAGLTFGAIQWPIPTLFEAPGGISYGYDNEVLLMVPVTVSKDAKPGDGKIEAHVSWLACKETCIEGEAKLAISLPIGAEAKPANRELFDTWQKRLPAPANQLAKLPMIEKVEQPAAAADGSPSAALNIQWKQEPKQVQWFPISTSAVAIEDVAVKHAGKTTRIGYKVTVYQPDQILDNQVDAVLVYEDAKGQRHGVSVPVRVPKSKR